MRGKKMLSDIIKNENPQNVWKDGGNYYGNV